jgi:hypothetical protein
MKESNAHPNCWITRMTVKESPNMLIFVFRLPDMVVFYRSSGYVFRDRLGAFFLDAMKTVLTSLNLSHLQMERLVIRATVSSF